MLKIEHVPLDKIIPYVNNPKKHPEEQIKKIASSILEFGFKVPIIVDKDYVIIVGHGRYEAAKRIGLKEVPVIVADDLSPAQVKAFRIADNKVAESDWDLDALAAELAQLKEIDYDLELTGYDEDEIKELIRELEVPEEEEVDEEGDELPEVDEEVEPFSKRGDIWLLGRHRVMCGDSTSRADVERLMDGAKADMVLTDPPYGINYQSNRRKNKFEKIKLDDNLQWASDVIKQIYDLLKDNTPFYCFTRWDVYPEWYFMIKDAGFKIKNMLIWVKHPALGGMGDLEGSYIFNFEVIIYATKGRVVLWEGGIGRKRAIIMNEEINNPSSLIHPNQKPVSLLSSFIEDASYRGDIILDLFGGSGTTLIAAEKTGRTCYMMELDPHYVDVIVWRYIHTTGKKDITLIRDGRELPFSKIESEFMARFE
ncbi:MAG: site-specific DNA-methyltransferase [Archaeoglobus sp.]|uniref:site-specific DNA-methyltransferase n=1 Tax=Archaeoglobus sp. TaxID=1872626 RepID=UPI001D9DEEDE|nr:site-specific DNA-methyltransferase [Archaeoglobus sp.]MBO8181069.1 site-specific DNA-methyltransferase [Archaeoglobus sp.]